MGKNTNNEIEQILDFSTSKPTESPYKQFFHSCLIGWSGKYEIFKKFLDFNLIKQVKFYHSKLMYLSLQISLKYFKKLI